MSKKCSCEETQPTKNGLMTICKREKELSSIRSNDPEKVRPFVNETKLKFKDLEESAKVFISGQSRHFHTSPSDYQFSMRMLSWIPELRSLASLFHWRSLYKKELEMERVIKTRPDPARGYNWTTEWPGLPTYQRLSTRWICWVAPFDFCEED